MVSHRKAMAARLTRRMLLGGAGAMGGLSLLPRIGRAQEKDPPPPPITFTNVRVFDGVSDTLKTGLNVTTYDGRIRSVDGSLPSEPGATTIDGGGRVLMPGLIDAHWHAMMAAVEYDDVLKADIGYINLVAGEEARRTLMRGFTTVRDMMGPVWGLKKAIDAKVIAGPRIFPSGAMISQTGGHGDYRERYEMPVPPGGALSHLEAIGAAAIADSPDEVRLRAREQLALGASQLKLAAGGGIVSIYDDIDVSEYTEAEFRAAVEAAENWGTYVTVHAYTPRAIKTAIKGGVKCIDHGHLMDDETATIMAQEGIWLSAQPFLENQFSDPPRSEEGKAKQKLVYAGTDTLYGLARKHGLKTAWGTDVLFSPASAAGQGTILTTMTRWYTPLEILKMATGTNGELLTMSGISNPYFELHKDRIARDQRDPDTKFVNECPVRLGVVAKDAYADLLLVEGDPTSDISVVANPNDNFRVIMKDGVVFKNTL